METSSGLYKDLDPHWPNMLRPRKAVVEPQRKTTVSSYAVKLNATTTPANGHGEKGTVAVWSDSNSSNNDDEPPAYACIAPLADVESNGDGVPNGTLSDGTTNGKPDLASSGVKAESGPSGMSNGTHKACPPLSAPDPTHQQPRFSKLSLDAKYDNESLLTRLWLQSRKDENTRIDTSMNGNRGSTPRRELSWTNFLLALDLLFILVPAGWAYLLSQREITARLCIFMLGQLLKGVSSSAEIVASSQLYGLMDASMKGRTVPMAEAVRAGAIAVFLTFVPNLQTSLFSYNSTVLNKMIKKQARQTIMDISLSQTITDTHDPLRVSLLDEATVSVGLGYVPNAFSSSNLLFTLGRSVHLITGLISNLFLMWRALSKGGKLLCWENALVVAIAVTPGIIRRMVYLWSFRRFADRRSKDPEKMAKQHETRQRKDWLRRLATNLEYKPETLLFGLKDFILGEHARLSSIPKEETEDVADERAADVIKATTSKAVDAITHILIVTRQGPDSVSFGSVNLLSKVMTKTLVKVGAFHGVLDRLVNEIFHVSAFLGAFILSRQPRGQAIDYETVRHPSGGMDLELRNVTFTYPGGDEDHPSLKNIDLKITAGETVAIVGKNGSGKSTLIKIVLGLYEGHEGLHGDVMINGHRHGDLDMPSVYARSTVVMQDFKRYRLTLADNVGIGDTTRIGNKTAVTEALARGGATYIEEKHGLDSMLNPFSTSDLGGSGQGPFGLDEKDKKRAKKGRKGRKDQKSEEDEEKKKDDLVLPEDKDKDLNYVVRTLRKGLNFLSMFVQDHKALKNQLRIITAFKLHQCSSLSGGEWQRIAVSRAFMRAKTCDMVAFDEPSSNLDAIAEADLFATLHSLGKAQEDGNRVTTVYVSHRFSTVRKASRIIYLEAGEIKEDGSHAELMALKGSYYEMFMLQRDGFDD